MKSANINNIDCKTSNKVRAEIMSLPGFPYQVAFINLKNKSDPSAVVKKDKLHLIIASDRHSYSKKDRIFPTNQDENTVFAQYVYNDSKNRKYGKILDVATGSGIIAMASAKAGVKDVIATDINKRSEDFIKINNSLNKTDIKFVKSDLFKNIRDRFDKITINPPFMPAPAGTFPLHAQGGPLGMENAVCPFFRDVWDHLTPGGCIQGIFHSFANDKSDSVLDLIEKKLPRGWSYDIRHVFPIKNMPLELYTSAFVAQKGYDQWLGTIHKKGYEYVRFYMLTIRNNAKNGLQTESFSKPRRYNLIYPPTTLDALKLKLKTKILKKPVSERDFPAIGHLMRLSRYNYIVYLTLISLFE